METVRKKLAIIDGKSVFYRGYYAMPNLATRDGTPTGGVYGFATMSLELIKKYQPDYVCVAWDKSGTNIRRRREIYPNYKAGRKSAPADFYTQIPILHDLLDALNWPLYQFDDYEADDIMGSLARQAEQAGLETMLISSDLDMLQCLAPHTHMYALKRGFSNIELYSPEHFEEKYGISVAQFLDLKSLKGDSSDNIPGVPGIGEKTAVKLLGQYGTLDGIYDNIDEVSGSTKAKLQAGRDSAYLSREVARLMFDAPLKLDLPAMDIRELDTAKLAAMLKELQFANLAKGLPEYMNDHQAISLGAPQQGLRQVMWSTELRTVAVMSDAVLLQVIGDNLYLSADRQSFAPVDATDLAGVLNDLKIVTHDGHALCHYLLDRDVALPKTLFDMRQAGFLINSLLKSRLLSDVISYQGDDVAVMMAELWSAYDRQMADLDRLPRVRDVAYQIDFPLIPVLAKIEHRGMKLDKTVLQKMSVELEKKLIKIAKEMYQLAGKEFNIASPTQLAEILYNQLHLPTVGIKHGKTGYSTGQKELDKLRGLHPIIGLVEQYRELSKLKNTYVDTLPQLTDEHDRLHTTFSQDVASSGRLSSSDPNLQNIPVRSELGREIRKAFVPSSGRVFVNADYSQFELRLAAVLSGDNEMIASFNADIDIHSKTAADVHGIAIADVTKSMRRDAKVINFGILYGMGPKALADNTGMTFADAKRYIDHYFQLRYKVREYLDKILRQAREEGYVETFYGRRRKTPDVQSSNFVVRSAAERAAMNMPIQGTEADLVKRAMIAVENQLGDRCDQVLQIHDSILVECDPKDASVVSELLKNIMESIAPELAIKLKVDVSIGENWGEI